MIRKLQHLWRKPAFEDAAPAAELYALDRFVTENVFTTKSGQYGVAYKLQGIDAECLSDETLESYSRRLDSAFRSLDEDFRIYQYMVRYRTTDLPEESPHPNPTVEQTLDNRREHLRQHGLYRIALYCVILLEPVSGRCTPQYLLTRAQSWERSCSDLLGLRLLDKQECFRVFRLLANLDHSLAEAEALRYDNYLDHWMGSSAVACAWESIAVDLQHVEILTLRETPRVTVPNLLGEFLKLEGDFILCAEYRREPGDTGVKAVNSAQFHYKAVSTLKDLPSILGMAVSKLFGNTEQQAKADVVPDASALQSIEELNGTIVRVNNEGDPLGMYSLTVVLHDRNGLALQGGTVDAIKILGSHEGSLVRETYNALNAYRAIIPGGHECNKRYLWLHRANFIDMGLLYAPHQGDVVNQHLNAPHLLTLQTQEGVPFFFNLHVDDLPDFCIMGKKGAGKSFLANTILDHAQKYNPLTFVLDIGGGYRLLADKHGGSYLNLRMHGNDFTMNPFALPRTPENLEFLASFVAILLQSSGHEPTPNDDRLIDKAVKDAARLGDLQLPDSLKDYLYNWIGDGRYAYLFDNPEDTLSLADMQCFDFTGMSANPRVIGPVFLYLFSRISQVVYNPDLAMRPKLFVADECWKFLKVRAAREYFIEAGKTFRKHNGGIGLITQSAGDLKKAGMLGMVKEMCPTLIFTANPGGDSRFYKRVGDLNDREVAILASLTPKREFLLKTPYQSKKLILEADPLAVLYYSNDPKTNARRDKAIRDHGIREGMKVLAKGA